METAIILNKTFFLLFILNLCVEMTVCLHRTFRGFGNFLIDVFGVHCAVVGFSCKAGVIFVGNIWEAMTQI